jgi:transcriptional regulator with XRE-family HTH domain
MENTKNTRVRKSEIPGEVIDFGNRISEIIKEKGLKIRHVAHDSDLDVENLRKYIKGKQEMKISTMIKISRALGVEIGYLFEGIK